jgi:hypothetical protein
MHHGPMSNMPSLLAQPHVPRILIAAPRPHNLHDQRSKFRSQCYHDFRVVCVFPDRFAKMAPVTPFNASDITEKARRDLLSLLEGVR